MLRDFIIGWLCIIGMVTYALLLGIRSLGRKTLSAVDATRDQWRAVVR